MLLNLNWELVALVVLVVLVLFLIVLQPAPVAPSSIVPPVAPVAVSTEEFENDSDAAFAVAISDYIKIKKPTYIQYVKQLEKLGNRHVSLIDKKLFKSLKAMGNDLNEQGILKLMEMESL